MINKKLRIDVLVDQFYPEQGGLAVGCFNVYKLMVENYEIHIHTSNENYLVNYELIEGIHVHRYNPFAYNLNPFILRINYFNTDIIVLNELIILPHYFIYIFTSILKLFSMKKYALILTSHGLFTLDLKPFKSRTRKLKRFIDRSIGIFLVKKTVDGIHAISKTEAEGLIRCGIPRNDISIFGNGLDDKAFKDAGSFVNQETKNKVKSYGKYILQVGRLDRIKNFELPIKALQFLPANINFIIAGPFQDKKYQSELLKLTQDLKLDNRVKFIGIVSGFEKYYLIKNSIVYTQMSTSEGSPLVLIEAMSQGVIPIVSRGTAMEETIIDGYNGYLANSDNFKDLAERIKFILDKENFEIHKKIKENCVEFTQEKTWEKVSSQLNDLFIKGIGKNKNSYV